MVSIKRDIKCADFCSHGIWRKESRWRYIADTREKTEFVVIVGTIKEYERQYIQYVNAT